MPDHACDGAFADDDERSVATAKGTEMTAHSRDRHCYTIMTLRQEVSLSAVPLQCFH